MTRAAALATTLVALALPVVLLGNALVVTAQPWIAHAEYALPWFPDDRLGLEDDRRTDLAVIGVRSVQPWSADGPAGLRAARLPSGARAFDAREVRHMGDVRGVLRGFLVAWLVMLAAVGGAIVVLRGGVPGAAQEALRRGARWTLAGFAALALFMVVAFETFFEGFHGVFFEGDSWRFSSDDTLRNLYPDAFWAVAGGVVAALVLCQALAILLLTRRRGSAPAR